MKYGSPFAFGIMATTGRLANDGTAAPAAAGRGVVTERTSQTLVTATISEPAMTAPHSTAT